MKGSPYLGSSLVGNFACSCTNQFLSFCRGWIFSLRSGGEPEHEQDLRRECGANTVTVIDGATNNTTTVAVGDGPRAVAVNAVTNKIYVASLPDSAGAETVTVIDGVTNNITTVTIGSYSVIIDPLAVAVNPSTNKIYVLNGDQNSNIVTVIDGATNNTTTVSVGKQSLQPWQ